MNSISPEEQNKKVKYDALEHSKFVGDIINRMGANHTSWLIALVTVMGFAFTIDSFVIVLNSINFNARIIVFSIISVMVFVVQIALLIMSRKYFILENIYRTKQKKIFEGGYSDWNLFPTDTPKKKWSWPFSFVTIVIVIYLIIQIVLGITFL